MPQSHDPNDPPPPKPHVEVGFRDPDFGSVHSDDAVVTFAAFGTCSVEDDFDNLYRLDDTAKLKLGRGPQTLKEWDVPTTAATSTWQQQQQDPVKIDTSGDYWLEVKLTARRNGDAITGRASVAFSVRITPPPRLELVEPDEGRKINDEPGTVKVTGKSSGTDPMTLTIDVDGWRSSDRIYNGTWGFEAIPVRGVGRKTITARLEDAYGRNMSATRHFEVIDVTAPVVTIEGPTAGERVWKNNLRVSGTVVDKSSGVASVECSWDGIAYNAATLRSDGRSWELRDHSRPTGPATVWVRAKDVVGKLSAPETRTFKIVDDVKPKDRDDVASRQAYLGDLLDYVAAMLVKKGTPNSRLTADNLETLFFQSFGRLLSQPARVSLALEPEIRIVSRTLFKYATSLEIAKWLIPIRRRHMDSAYGVLLSAIGTSIEELRAVAAGLPGEREALASRLGIPLSVGPIEDTIGQLLLASPDALTEEAIGALFGYESVTDPIPDTHDPSPDPDARFFAIGPNTTPGANRFSVDTCRMTQWRQARVFAAALAEDCNATSPLVLDPDIVGPNDLVPNDRDGRDRLEKRAKELDNLENACVEAIGKTAGWPDSSPADVVAKVASFITLSTDAATRTEAIALHLVAAADIGDPAKVLTASLGWFRDGRSEPVVFRLLQLQATALRAILALVDGNAAHRDSSAVLRAVDGLVLHGKRTLLAARWKAEEIALALCLSPERFVPPSAESVILPGLQSTGLDVDGLPLPIGGEELHWKVTANGADQISTVIDSHPDWAPNDDRARWIQVPLPGVPGTFSCTFSTRGFEPSSVQATLQIAAFHTLSSARLVPGSTDDPDRVDLIRTNFESKGTSFFASADDEIAVGDNTLTFVVDPRSPTEKAALRVQFEVRGIRSARAAIHRRGSVADRMAWEEKLLSRAAQWGSIPAGLAAACALVDSQTLPVLRDNLVRVAGTGANEPSRGLNDRLLVDVTVGASRLSSPAEVAGRMLQTLLSLVATAPEKPNGSPANLPFIGWKDAETQEAVIADTPILGSYDAWRGASLAFWYPENILLPTLLGGATGATPAFKTWIKEYLVKGEAASPTGLTDLEANFGVPVQTALSLQAKGDNIAALTKLRELYDYHLSVPKKWERLKTEATITSQYGREPRWFNGLNPHKIAEQRKNAYTRFLMASIARILLDTGDAAQVEGDDTANDRARMAYGDAKSLLDAIPPPADPSPDQFVPANPLLEALRTRAESALARLRAGVDITGLVQTNVDNLEVGIVDVGSDGALRVVASLPPPPTPYRFISLIDRAKNLLQLSQTVESLYLAALKDRDAEYFTLLKAQQEVGVAKLQQAVATARVDETIAAKAAVRRRADRARVSFEHYTDLVERGVSHAEAEQLRELQDSAELQTTASNLAIASSVASFIGATNAAAAFETMGASVFSSLASGLSSVSSATSALAANRSTLATTWGVTASYERRREDWSLQAQVANADLTANRADAVVADRNTAVARAESKVAEAQYNNAQATVTFLNTKLSGFALYEFMSRVLGDVYRNLLGLATATSRLAERQLAFERQQPVAGLIRRSYWDTRELASSDGRDFSGLTGSARLAGDIATLDQRAFETTQRKLQLRKSFSLARLFPTEFRQFRRTGVLPFTTPMELFDRDFPGHYLRLINSAKISIVALTPALDGVRGALYCAGASRVVVENGGAFRSLVQRRLPETIAFTSPTQAAGLFDVDLQPELLRPFEGLGVDTSWVLELPRAANPFDYSTLIDVMLTLEYTALFDPGYRLKVTRELSRTIEAERTFSLRSNFPDAWYSAQNGEDTDTDIEVTIELPFEITEADFPRNHGNVVISALTIFAVPNPQDPEPLPELTFSLKLTAPKEKDPLELGSGTTRGGVVGTRRGDAVWSGLAHRPPFGRWRLATSGSPESRAALQRVGDLVVSIAYRALLPEWPS